MEQLLREGREESGARALLQNVQFAFSISSHFFERFNEPLTPKRAIEIIVEHAKGQRGCKTSTLTAAAVLYTICCEMLPVLDPQRRTSFRGALPRLTPGAATWRMAFLGKELNYWMLQLGAQGRAEEMHAKGDSKKKTGSLDRYRALADAMQASAAAWNPKRVRKWMIDAGEITEAKNEKQLKNQLEKARRHLSHAKEMLRAEAKIQ